MILSSEGGLLRAIGGGATPIPPIDPLFEPGLITWLDTMQHDPVELIVLRQSESNSGGNRTGAACNTAGQNVRLVAYNGSVTVTVRDMDQPGSVARTYEPTGANGSPCVAFSGANSTGMRGPATPPLLSGIEQWYAACLLYVDSGGSAGAEMVAFGASTTDAKNDSAGGMAIIKSTLGVRLSAQNFLSASTTVAVGWHLLEMGREATAGWIRIDGGTKLYALNGVDPATLTDLVATPYSPDKWAIAQRVNGSAFLSQQCKLARLWITSQIPSDAKQLQLASEWGTAIGGYAA